MTQDDIIERAEADLRWDTGELGRDIDHAKPAELSADEIAAINTAAGLKMISIRLPDAMIENFRFMADHHGLRYQTLMRQALARFADSEMKRLAQEAAAEQIAQRRIERAEEVRKSG